MKKLVILSMAAVAALGLAACKPTTPAGPGNDISNEGTLNTEAPLENVTEEPMLNTSVDANASVLDNATAIDNASNVTAK